MKESARRAVTITDVARVAGVSRAAVSKVIREAYGVSDDMRTRVNAAISELGYRPSIAARSMRGASLTVGVELPEAGSDYFTKIVHGAMDVLGETRYQLILAPIKDAAHAGDALQALADRQVDGIIAVSPLVSREWLDVLAAQLPIVVIGRHDRSDFYDTVNADDRAGTEQAMEHLLGLGHRAIAHLTLREELTDSQGDDGHSLRLAGYRAVAARSGFEPLVLRSSGGVQDARDVVLQALGSPLAPTAIFAAHDALAIGALQAREEAGLSPAKLSIVGYDDVGIAGHPLMSLTSVDQFGEELGKVSATFLLERIAGRDQVKNHVQKPLLRARNSTASPADRALPSR